MKKKIFYPALSLLFCAAFFSACTKKETPPPETTAAEGSVPASQSNAALQESEAPEAEVSEYFYTKIHLPYADYFYGELMNIEPESNPHLLVLNLDAQDPVHLAGFRDASSYSGFSTGGRGDLERFGSLYGKEGEEGGEILGVADVNIAIPKSLYQQAQHALQEGKESNNPSLSFIAEVSDLSEAKPEEYKVLNSDGSLSKMIRNSRSTEAKTALTTISDYGNYQIEIEGIEINPASVQALILETAEGNKYGLLPIENFDPEGGRIFFSSRAFTDIDGKAARFQRFAGIEGQRIIRIDYLLADQEDISIETSLLCKLPAPEGCEITGEERIPYAPGKMLLQYDSNTGESEYHFSRVLSRTKALDFLPEQSGEGSFRLTERFLPGNYLFVFSNDRYEDLAFPCLIESGLEAEDFSFENGKLLLRENPQKLDIMDYVEAITAARVNEREYRDSEGLLFGTAAFFLDGTLKLDAGIRHQGREEALFEGAESYRVHLEAAGYPDVDFELKP